jgi:hypothetical protein
VIYTRIAARVKSGDWDPAAEKLWHDTEFQQYIPVHTCDCREKWSKKSNRINWDSAMDAFRSISDLQNEVNRDLGKPEVSIDEAIVKWIR